MISYDTRDGINTRAVLAEGYRGGTTYLHTHGKPTPYANPQNTDINEGLLTDRDMGALSRKQPRISFICLHVVFHLIPERIPFCVLLFTGAEKLVHTYSSMERQLDTGC